jgi:hypothetical protein
MSVVGCELGATELISARRDVDADTGINHRAVPSVYVEVLASDLARLAAAGLVPVSAGGHYFVVGAEAYTVMTLLGVAPHRPLAWGALAPADAVGALALTTLLQQVLGYAASGERCRFSVPPPVRDGSGYDLERSRAFFTRQLAQLGYASHARPTPQAVALSAGPAPTVLALYLDLGLAQVGLYYEGLPVVEFSLVAGGGHEIDRRTAVTLALPVEVVAARRTGPEIDFTDPRTALDQVLVNFTYLTLGEVFGQLIREALTVQLPHSPVPVLVSGSAATGVHYIDLVRQVCTEIRAALPLQLGAIELAANPRFVAATGLLDD